MSGLVRLREVVKGRHSTWHVEDWQGNALASSASYPDRPAARDAARRLADSLDTVVILAGPDRLPVPKAHLAERGAR